MQVNDVTLTDVLEWHRLQIELKEVKAREMELRKKLASSLFPTPIEGTNKRELGDYILKLNYKIDRDIDEASLSSVVRTLHENGIPVDELISYKPSLVLSAYRKLEKEQLKLFDNVLIIKPATPSLSVDKVKK